MPKKKNDTVEIGNVLFQADEIDNESVLFDYETSNNLGGIDKPTNSIFEGLHDESSVNLLDGLEIRCSIDDEFSYISYHADILYKYFHRCDTSEYSFFKSIKIINNSEYVLENLRIEIQFSNPIFKCKEILISVLEHNRTLDLKCPNIIVDLEKLLLIQAKTPIMFDISIYSNETNKLIYRTKKDYVFTCLPVSQPSSKIVEDERLYAKLVTPQATEVKKVTLDALAKLEKKAIIGYQNKDVNDIIAEAKAIYDTLADCNICYQNPPANDVWQQKIRMPKEVLDTKKGTCIDLAILYSSCLEEVGIHSILAFTDTHCFTGFFLNEEEAFQNGICLEAGKINSLVGDQINKLVLVEATNYAVGCKNSFKSAMYNGKLNVSTYKGKDFNAIDVFTCHKGIFSPLVFDNTDTILESVIKEKISDETVDPINEATFTDISHNKEMDKFTYWEHKLLDLNEANQLINMSINPNNTVKIIFEKPLYDYLLSNTSFKLDLSEVKVKAKDYVESFFLTPNVKPSNFDRTLKTDLIYALCTDDVIKSLIKKSESATDETGAPTLYLCFGIISFKRLRNEKRANCPFLILPIRASKDKNSKRYTITYDFDDIMLNETFFEYFKTINPDSDYSSIYDVSSEYTYTDIINTFKKYCNDDIVLEPNLSYITNLTFSNYILWLDVRKRQEELRKNRVIDSIIKSQNQLEKIDDEISEDYSDLAAPLSFDSTQVKAIEACSKGKSFILDGPPGTGKSQTIVNMIVNAFYHGKTVLFVAEKKAALDVVADRLASIKLDRFCLELHSNKASKRAFFGKLGDVMDEGRISGNDDYSTVCNDLSLKMDNITKKLTKLHNKKYYLSLYESIVDYEELLGKTKEMKLSTDTLENFNEAKHIQLDNIIDNIVNLASDLPDFDESLLRYFGSSKLSYNEKEDFIKEMSDLLSALNKAVELYLPLSRGINISFNNTVNEYNIISELYEIIFKEEIYSKAIPDIMSIPDDTQTIYCLSKAIELNKFIIDNQNKYDYSKLLDAKFSDAVKDLETPSFFKNIKYKNRLKKYVLKEYKIDGKKLKSYYDEIAKYNELVEQINNSSRNIDKFSGLRIIDNISKAEDINKAYLLTKRFIELLKSLNSNDFINASAYFIDAYEQKPTALKMQYFAYDEIHTRYVELLNKAVNKYNIYIDDLKNEDIKALIDLFNVLSDSTEYNHIIMMTSINYELNKLNDTGFEEIAIMLRNKEISYMDIHNTVSFNLAYGFIKLYFRDDEINYFSSSLISKEINEYKKLINEYSSLVVEETAHRLTDNLIKNNVNYAASSPIGQLKKFISSGGRGITIREALVNYDELIRSYFPCFLMSPLSAAQYLAIDSKDKKGASKFDIVIFDEASQIPTHEAIGAIARGNSLIVAGDPEQMPPSAYFSAGLEMADDFIRFEDASSLLDECLAIDLPRIRLSYHYRSRHESLISFSNKNFYNNGLYTFPSPSISENHVEFKLVELKERKLKSNITNEEINAILDTVKDIYSNEKNEHKSLGIIVFNVTQAEKLSEKMNALLAKDKKLATIFENLETPYFIKSLENVQGDERDIIILSVGFRLNDANRAVVLGPIARDHGERRLNVAITRSKEKMYVISTIKSENFDTDDNISNRGTLLLKQFLKYAEQANEYNIHKKNADKTIALYIKHDLEDLGYDVDMNIGESRYKVDLAIKNAETKNYDLGIIIDNSTNGEEISLRDSVYLKNSVFNALAWNIVDVYSVDYYKDKKAVIDQIIKALRKNESSQIQDLNINLRKLKEEEFKYATIEYKEYKSKARIGYSTDLGFDKNLSQAVKSIIAIESPVSFNTIKQRIKQAAGMQKMSDKAQGYLKAELKNYPYTTKENDLLFYWKDNNKNVVKFRNAYDRDIYDICNEEIICAMKQILDIQVELSKEDLYKLTLEALGYQSGVLNKKNADRLDMAYNIMKKN